MGALKLTYKNPESLNLKVVYKNPELSKTEFREKETPCFGALSCYPGGSIMPGRSYSSNSYRFGYNAGSEKDDEITGVTGSHYTTFYRELDTRVVRWWSIDPKTKLTPWESPYSSMGNNPIWYNDPLGDIWDNAASKEQSDKMDTQAKSRITENNNKINELSEGGTESIIKNIEQIASLQAQNNELHNSIDERAQMGDENNPVRYRFEKEPIEGGGTDVDSKGLFNRTHTVIMTYGDDGDAFHEQLHGYRRGKEILSGVRKGSGYDVSEEVDAKRREFSVRSQDYINRAPLMQGGYFSITNAKWVERVLIRSKDHEFVEKHEYYRRITNKWLRNNQRRKEQISK